MVDFLIIFILMKPVEQSMGARNQEGIGLSYGSPGSMDSRNRFLGIDSSISELPIIPADS
jgi:hypothetical protein